MKLNSNPKPLTCRLFEMYRQYFFLIWTYGEEKLEERMTDFYYIGKSHMCRKT